MKDNKQPLMWLDLSPTPDNLMYSAVHKIYAHKKTEFQELLIVECGDYGKSLILDGESQSSVNDEYYYHEALVHPASIIHGSPKKVLILGGGEGATIREVLKWKTIKSVCMVDIDNDVVNLCKQHLTEMHQGSFDDPRVNLIIQDAEFFLQHTNEKWDLIISDLTSPSEGGSSYNLFTKKYISLCKNLLADNGIFAIQAGPISPIYMKSHVKIAKILKEIFPFSTSYAILDGWGFILGRNSEINIPVNPTKIDRILSKNTTNNFRAIDGITIIGMMHTPKYLRKAIS